MLKGKYISITMDAAEEYLDEGHMPADCPDGCFVEPDGCCEHGHDSILLIHGLI